MALPAVAAQLAGWTTPNARDWKSEVGSENNAYERNPNLSRQAYRIGGWSTPRASDGAKGGPNMSFGAGGTPLPSQAAQLAGWSTPTVPNGGRKPKGGAMSMTGRTPEGAKRQVDLNWQAGQITSSSDPTRTGSTGALNPAFVCWLMGYPDVWLSCVDWATRSSRKKRPK